MPRPAIREYEAVYIFDSALEDAAITEKLNKHHALLSTDAIVADGLTLAGWVANVVDPHVARLQDNLATLAERLPAPCLGQVPFLPSICTEQVAQHLDLSRLML